MAAPKPLYPKLGSSELQAYISISDILKDLMNHHSKPIVGVCLSHIIDELPTITANFNLDLIGNKDNRSKFEKSVLSVNPDINKFLISGLDKYPYVDGIFPNKLPPTFTNFFYDQGKQPMYLASDENKAYLIMNPGKCMDPGPTSLDNNRYIYPFDEEKHTIIMKPYGFKDNVIFMFKFTIPISESEKKLTCEIWIKFNIDGKTYEYNTKILQNSKFSETSSQEVLEELNIINAADDTVIQRLFQHTRDGGGRIFSTPPNPNPNPYTSKMYSSNINSNTPAFFSGNNEKNTFIENAKPSQQIDVVISTLYILCKVFGDLLQAVFAQQLLVADSFLPKLTSPYAGFTNENTALSTHDNMLAARCATLGKFTFILTINTDKYTDKPNYSGAILYPAGDTGRMNIEMIKMTCDNIYENNQRIIATLKQLIAFTIAPLASPSTGIDASKIDIPNSKQLTNIFVRRESPDERIEQLSKVGHLIEYVLLNGMSVIQDAFELYRNGVMMAYDANKTTIDSIGIEERYDMSKSEDYDKLNRIISALELNELIRIKSSGPIQTLFVIGNHNSLCKKESVYPIDSIITEFYGQQKLLYFMQILQNGESRTIHTLSNSVYNLLNYKKSVFDSVYQSINPLQSGGATPPPRSRSRSPPHRIRSRSPPRRFETPLPSEKTNSRARRAEIRELIRNKTNKTIYGENRYNQDNQSYHQMDEIPPHNLLHQMIESQTPDFNPNPQHIYHTGLLTPPDTQQPGTHPPYSEEYSRDMNAPVPLLNLGGEELVGDYVVGDDGVIKSHTDILYEVYNILYELFSICGIIVYNNKNLIIHYVISQVYINNRIDITYLIKQIIPSLTTDEKIFRFIYDKNFRNSLIIPLLIDENIFEEYFQPDLPPENGYSNTKYLIHIITQMIHNLLPSQTGGSVHFKKIHNNKKTKNHKKKPIHKKTKKTEKKHNTKNRNTHKKIKKHKNTKKNKRRN